MWFNGGSYGKGHAIKPLNELTATEIVSAIGDGRVTCEAVVRACLDRIAARDRDVHAWAHLDPAVTLAAARGLDKNGRRAVMPEMNTIRPRASITVACEKWPFGLAILSELICFLGMARPLRCSDRPGVWFNAGRHSKGPRHPTAQ